MSLSSNQTVDRRTHFSFDVFDTAICRLIHSPEHIHFIVGKKLRKRGITTLSDTMWLYARAECEFQQRLTVPHREVTLTEIYARLANLLRMTPRDASTALNLELEEEFRLVKPIALTRERIFELIRANTSPIFISDTYFTSKQVAALLAQAGYIEPFDIVTSCQELKSKFKGTIFNHIAAQRNLPANCFQHVGDNATSDVHNARAHGWNAEHFNDSHWTTRERILFASGDGNFLSSAIAGSARAARLGQSTPLNKGITSAAASVVGPLFAAYVLWILLDVLARGCRSIYFLARDGQVMVPICQRLVKWLGADIDVHYTYASRQAFLLSALPQDSDDMVDEAMRLAYYDFLSLSEAMVSLKYTDNEMLRVSKNAAISLQRTANSLHEREKISLRNALLDAEVLNPLRARAHAARAATLSYLETQGMFSSAEACIVDLGWRGNTQLRLQKTVGGRVSLIGYYMGLSNSVLTHEAKRCVWTTGVPLKTGLLEVMAAADHTSVRGFGFAEDGKPVCSPPISEDLNLISWGVREQQEIALRFTDYIAEAVEPTEYTPEELYAALSSAGLDAYRHFRLSPTREEAEAYGGMLHQNDVNHTKREELAQIITSLDIVKHFFNRKSKSAVSGWYMGSIARSNGSLIPMLISKYLDRAFEIKARLKTRHRRRAAQRALRNDLNQRRKIPSIG